MADHEFNTRDHRVTVVSADDWAGIYVGDALFTEGHSVPKHEWIELLRRFGVDVQDLSETDEAYKVIEEHGRCPLTLTDWNETARG